MATEANQPDLARGPFDGRHAFHDLLRSALQEAAGQQWREILLCDPDFADWPLGERAVADALQAWSSNGRKLVLLARRFDAFDRQHARFVHWRRLWSHIVECRACDGPGLPDVPSGMWTPSWFVHRIDVERARGTCGIDPAGRKQLRERADECLRHSRPAFPATTLGL
ncbi:conserved hypothetical protein [Burkholderiales bacterium 8X]|nr:conserved hypothetical protein [Burkholderiales bacterium 8X]